MSATSDERKLTGALATDIRRDRFRAGEIKMIPDAAHYWQIHVLPDDMGTLVMPNVGDVRVVGVLSHFAIRQESIAYSLANPPHGECAAVSFARNNIAAKHFFPDAASERYAGIHAVQANYVLEEGLRRLGAKAALGAWRVSAPRQHGVLLRPPRMGSPVWVMDRARGVQGDKAGDWHEQAGVQTRLRVRLLGAAAEACHVDPTLIAFDDDIDNYLVRAKTSQLIRLDVHANGPVVPGTEGIINVGLHPF